MLTDYKAIIVDATGTELTKDEEQLFKAENPPGLSCSSATAFPKNR